MKQKNTTGNIVFRSVWWTLSEDGKKVTTHTSIYRRAKPKLHKGSKACRWAKRQKVAAMKAAEHFRGNNEPFEWGKE